MDELTSGFTFQVEHIRDGQVIDTETVHNLMPIQGMNYILDAAIKGTVPVPSAWYMGIYEGAYDPLPESVSATFHSFSTESTAYAGGVRKQLVLGTTSGGAVSNSASACQFEMTATRTIYGCFVDTGSARQSSGNTLLSATRFTTAKSVVSGDIIRVIGGFTLSNGA